MEMIREELQKHQKVAYRILENALLRHTFAHAYLFVGESGTPKLEAAYLLIQSLLCEREGFACEKCESCQHVVNGGYGDLIYVDGKSKSIKKQDILSIQERFSKTKLERKGKKVYLLDGVENATKEALNALLKFLEEPDSDTLAILICDHSDRLLETIVSRTQIIPFYKQNSHDLWEKLKEEMEPLEAYLLSNMSANDKQAMERYETDEFQHAYYLFSHFLEEYEKHPVYARVFLQKEGFGKSKRDDRLVAGTFFDMMILLCRDCYRRKEEEITHIWGKNGEIMLKLEVEKMHKICIECKDKIVRSINIPLLIDQFLYQWEVEDGKA